MNIIPGHVQEKLSFLWQEILIPIKNIKKNVKISFSSLFSFFIQRIDPVFLCKEKQKNNWFQYTGL